MYKKKPFVLYFLTLLILQSSCITFYKSRSMRQDENSSTLQSLENFDTGKYRFVIHSGDLLWAIDYVKFSEHEISGSIGKLNDQEYAYYKKLSGDQRTARVPIFDRQYIYQVHIFVDKLKQNNNILTIHEDDIKGVQIYNIDGALTFVSYAATASVVTIAAIGTFLIIVCNCPHVYTYNGDTYNYTNTLFTGAVSPKLERYDYKIMPDYFPGSHEYKLMLKNDEAEKQYTNEIGLMVVHHNKKTEVYPDQNGNVYGINSPRQPVKIVDDLGENVADLIAAPDNVPFSFDTKSEHTYANLYPVFNVNNENGNAALVLRLKNSKWGGFIYHEFSKKFGRYHDNWVRKNQKQTKEQMEETLKDHGITMLVSVKQGNEWIDVEEIDLIGDVAYQSLVIPIDKKYLSNETLEIRLRSGFKFWEIDYIAFENNAEKDLEVGYPSLQVVNNGASTELIEKLQTNDDLYMEHTSTGDSTYISFKGLKSKEGMSRTLILKSKGFYKSQVKFKGKPDFAELKKFRDPGELSKYSRRLYNTYVDNFAVNQ